ncbi:MAG: BatD family protein [Thermoanaerobaculia bacterium]
MASRASLGARVVGLAGLAASIAAAASAQSSASATARIQPQVIGVGQVVNLILEAQGTGLKDLQLDPQFSLENLEIVSGPAQSQTWQFVNGRASRAESLSWRLRATSVGAARVTGIVLKVNDEVFELAEQVVQVQEDPVEMTDPFGRSRLSDPFENFPFSRRRSRPTRDTEPKLFLRAEVTPKEPYAGQQVLYTLYLFTQADVGAIDPESVPDFQGFWVEDVPQPERLRPEMVDIQGQRYGRVVLLRKAVFPMRPGTVELEPVKARLVVSMPEYGWLGSVIDRKREIVRTSNPVSINVRPLPDAPDGFRGAVGRLELSATLDPAELRVGEAATLAIKLEGQGNIQGIQAPDLPSLDGVRVFPPEQGSRSRVSGTRVRGQKTWTYVLVPDRAGQWEMPNLEVPYFDPFEGSFETAKAAPMMLSALDPLASVPSVTLGEVPSADPNEPDKADSVATQSELWYRYPAYLAISGGFLIALLLIPLLLHVRRKARSTKLLCDRLRAASGTRHGRKAAEQLEDAWRVFLEERHEIGPGTAAAAWTEHLRGRGIAAAIVDEFGKLVEDLEYLRYAPELSASESLIADVIARSLKLCRGLR